MYTTTSPTITTGTPRRGVRRRPVAVLAREHRPAYLTESLTATVDEDQAGWGGSSEVGTREQIRSLHRQARRLLTEVTHAGVSGGELGALVDLARLADTVQAAMVAVTSRIEDGMLAQRRAGLPLVDLLALETRLTHTERRGLVRTAAGLDRMPALAAAVREGLVGAGEARAVLAESRRLDATARAELDTLFADHDVLRRHDVEAVLDEVAATVAGLSPKDADDDRIKAYERRFLSVTAGATSTLAGYFEIDDSCGAIVLRALDDAAVPLTGPRAATRDALPLPGLDEEAPDRRTLGRRRADALVALAEHWLASHPDPSEREGPSVERTPRRRRARPLVHVWTDIRTLTGDDAGSAGARLVWDTLAPQPVLTARAVQRLASDARLRFILADGGEVLGVAAPVATIPAKVRIGVHARDRHCRFPGCRVPARQTDLHHVVPRADGGPTLVTNLVAVCRRHHVAVTEGRWRLTMSPDGIVTVRRGRHVATSDPPAARALRPTA
jgi:hypothetical protein